MDKIENDFNKICFPNLIFQYKNHFQEDQVDFWTKKFTLKTENFKLLKIPPQIVLQYIKKSFK